MTISKTGQLSFTLATWIFILDERGTRPQDDALREACDALRAADEGVDVLGLALVAAVEDSLGDNDVTTWLKGLYGDDHIATDLGADRDARARTARAYQFKTSLPWLAQIVDRTGDGELRVVWVLVEGIDDTVRCMDPYPWDDLDESLTLPVVDFMVRWELAGGQTLRWV